MRWLVKLQNQQPVISTFDLFKQMGYTEHRKLKEVINANKPAFNDLGLLPLERVKPTKKTGGRPTESYLLNEDHFVLLVILAKNSPESLKLKIRVSKEFNRLKKTVALLVSQQSNKQWQEDRLAGKPAYIHKLDTIKAFVEYAIGQGSKNAERYYTSLAIMINSQLFDVGLKITGSLRQVLDSSQLARVRTADEIVDKALIKGMGDGLPYKEVFQLAKLRVNTFCEIVGGKVPVLALPDCTVH